MTAIFCCFNDNEATVVVLLLVADAKIEIKMTKSLTTEKERRKAVPRYLNMDGWVRGQRSLMLGSGCVRPV